MGERAKILRLLEGADHIVTEKEKKNESQKSRVEEKKAADTKEEKLQRQRENKAAWKKKNREQKKAESIAKLPIPVSFQTQAKKEVDAITKQKSKILQLLGKDTAEGVQIKEEVESDIEETEVETKLDITNNANGKSVLDNKTREDLLGELEIIQKMVASSVMENKSKIEHLKKDNKKVELLKKKNEEYCQALDGVGQLMEVKDAEIESKEVKLNETIRQLNKKGMELEAANVRCRVYEIQIKSKDEEITEKEKEIKEKDIEISLKSVELEMKNMKIKEKENEINLKDQELTDKDNTIKDLFEDMKQNEVASDEVLKETKEKLSELGKLKGEDMVKLFERNQILEKASSELNRQVEMKEVGIQKCKTDFGLLQEKIDGFLLVREGLQQTIKKKEEEIRKLKERKKGRPSDLEQAKKENSELKKQVETLTYEVDKCKEGIVNF